MPDEPIWPAVGPGASSLAALTDVAETNPLRGQSLRYNGTKWANEGESVFYATDYGVIANGKTVTDAAITSGQATLTSVSAGFTPADAGKLVVVIGAGAAGAHLYTTIVTVTAGVATLAANASTTVSAAEVFYATDDTAAAQACITAAANATALFPNGHVGLSAALTSAQPIQILGQGCMELYGGTDNSNTAVFPTIAPYLVGSVLVQCAASTDILQLTAVGRSQHARKLGLRFAGRYASTGHGLTQGIFTGLSYGNIGSLVEDVKVFGVDGNHYGFNIGNPELQRWVGLRSYGGGGLTLYGQANNPGNITSEDCYFATYINGTSHALYLNLIAGGLDYTTFTRLQTWVFTPSPALSGTTPPASTQLNQEILNPNSAQFVSYLGPDFEASAGVGGVRWPQGNGCFYSNKVVAAVKNTVVPTGFVSGTNFTNTYGTALLSCSWWTLNPAAAAVANTTLNGAVVKGATSVLLTSAAGMSVGDVIQIGGVTDPPDYRVISSIAANTVSFVQGLDSAHASGAAVTDGAACVIATSKGNVVSRIALPVGAPQGTQMQLVIPIPAGATFSCTFGNAIVTSNNWLDTIVQ